MLIVRSGVSAPDWVHGFLSVIAFLDKQAGPSALGIIRFSLAPGFFREADTKLGRAVFHADLRASSTGGLLQGSADELCAHKAIVMAAVRYDPPYSCKELRFAKDELKAACIAEPDPDEDTDKVKFGISHMKLGLKILNNSPLSTVRCSAIYATDGGIIKTNARPRLARRGSPKVKGPRPTARARDKEEGEVGVQIRRRTKESPMEEDKKARNKEEGAVGVHIRRRTKESPRRPQVTRNKKEGRRRKGQASEAQ